MRNRSSLVPPLTKCSNFTNTEVDETIEVTRTKSEIGVQNMKKKKRRRISFIIVHCCSPKPRLGTLQMHSRLPAYPRMMVRGLEAAAWGTNNRPGNQQPLCAGELQNKIRNISSSRAEVKEEGQIKQVSILYITSSASSKSISLTFNVRIVGGGDNIQEVIHIIFIFSAYNI